MTENYYEILGVPVGAEKKDIKRAYFKLVRTYSPEKDPEKFQKIRNAYENLMSDNIALGEVPTSIPDVPLAKSMMRQIEACMKKHDYAGVAATAEEAMRFFGEIETFQYYQGKANCYAGNTGKAVKNFEKLTKSYPDKVLYFRELAISYMERGFGKKAFTAFGQAYEMGARDDEFLRLFSLCCNERHENNRGTEILFVLIKKENRNLHDSLDELLEAFNGLFLMNLRSEETKLLEILFEFYRFIETADVYIQEYQESVIEVFMSMMMACIGRGTKVQSEVEKVANRLKTRLPEGHINKLMDSVKMDALKVRIDYDERLSELMKMGYEAFVDPPDMYEDEPQLLHFMRLDVELCILEDWDSIQKEIEIIKQEYPQYYEAVSEFIDRLEHGGNQDLLRERLQKDYDRLGQYISGGTYYKKYPERQRHSGEVKWDSNEEGTFIRQEPKVGRNDPCPCGSGKKYKKCCGRK